MKRFLFLFSCLILAISQMWAQSDPNYPISMTPAPGSEVSAPVTEISFTYGKELNQSKFKTNFDVYATVYRGATGWNWIAKIKEITLSSDNKTITFKLPTSINEKDVVFRIQLNAELYFKDGAKASAVEYTFTYAEPQLDPVSSFPGDGEPHDGYLTSYSLTFDQPITNTPAAGGLKIKGLKEYLQVYDQGNVPLPEHYGVYSTSTKAELSADKKTVTYTITHNYYGNEFYAELEYGALEFAGAKSAPVKRRVYTTVTPKVELWGNHTRFNNASQVTQLDSISLIFEQCNSTWPVSLDDVTRANFGTIQGIKGLAWIQKKKGDNWIDYQMVRLDKPGNSDKSVAICPVVVNEKGEIASKQKVYRPGQYRLIVPVESIHTRPDKKSDPVQQLMNKEMEITFSIAGDESTDYLTPLSTDPADKSKVSNQLSHVSLTFSLPITNMPQAETLKVYNTAGTKLLGTASSVTLSDDQMTITYILDTPVKTWGTVNVQIGGSVLGGEGWTNEPVERRVIIQERRQISTVVPEGTWRLEGIEIQMEGNPGQLQGNVRDYIKAFPLFRKNPNGEDEDLDRVDISTQGITYDANKKTCTIPLVPAGRILTGEGDYYVDIPVGFIRYAAETNSEDGVDRWIESEATRLEFHLGPQQPTQFTVSPAPGSQLSKITDFTLTITEAESLQLAGKLLPSEYIWVSKDGGDPIKYIMYDSDRDGEPSGDSEYASSDVLVISTKDELNSNEVKFKIHEGFETPNEDTYGFASSGTYTITVPANMFNIDATYFNTDMTFTYTVKNNVVETRKFKGKFDVTPVATDTIIDLKQLEKIRLKFWDADLITMTNVKATIKGDTSKETYMTLASATAIDDVTWELTMQRNESVEEHQDDVVVFTFEATVNADGTIKRYGDSDDMDVDYGMDSYATTWRYMTLEAYNANYVTFSPNKDEVESLSTFAVTPADDYKFFMDTRVDTKLDLYWNDMKLIGYYVTGKRDFVNNTGSMTIYDSKGNPATLTVPGDYTIKVPYGFFRVQEATTFKELPIKAEDLSIKVTGVPSIGILTRFIDGTWAEPVNAENAKKIGGAILEQ